MQTIMKIVVTGGPCAGKSTALSYIFNHFTKLGWVVLFVPETATELISNGVTPWGLKTSLDYQRCNLKLQIEKEKIFDQAARCINSDKILIVCDRGTLDNKAYMTNDEFNILLKEMGLNEVELRDTYEAIFHLVTAAKGAKEFYTLENNQARTETPEQAIELDDKIIASWTGHPHLRVIGNECSFDAKMTKLISEIAHFLGEPEPYEIERKYLIRYPDLNWLESNPACQRVEIIQTYLNSSNPDEEIRVRQRGRNGKFIYFQTTKKKISGLKRIETERRLSEHEYLRLLMNADTTKHQIRKTRYCLTYDGQYLEIDVYPFWQDRAILEVELSNENEEVRFPKEINVVKEVTDDDNYKNAHLASLDINILRLLDKNMKRYTTQDILANHINSVLKESV